MVKIKTIIVDDELEAREGIKALLKNDVSIEIIALCKNGIEAIDILQQHQIDLMFLDIQMPVINGFEVVHSIPKERLPHIIFVTAYDQYALKAFEVHALDYILKPFTNQRFQESLNRAKSLIDQHKIKLEQDRLASLSESLLKENGSNDQLLISEENDQRLVVKEKGRVIFVPLMNIIWVEAFDYYVKIHVKNHFYTVRESLKKMLERLPGNIFMRIHKSAIINIQKLKSIDSQGQGVYELKLINYHLPIKTGRAFKEQIVELLKDLDA